MVASAGRGQADRQVTAHADFRAVRELWWFFVQQEPVRAKAVVVGTFGSRCDREWQVEYSGFEDTLR